MARRQSCVRLSTQRCFPCPTGLSAGFKPDGNIGRVSSLRLLPLLLDKLDNQPIHTARHHFTHLSDSVVFITARLLSSPPPLLLLCKLRGGGRLLPSVCCGKGCERGGWRWRCRWLIKVETPGSANMTKEKDEAAFYSGLLITLKPPEFTSCQAAALVHCWQTAAMFFITPPNRMRERNSYVWLWRLVVIYTIYASNREDGLNDIPK